MTSTEEEREEKLIHYINTIYKLRNKAKSINLSNKEINNLFTKWFQDLEKEQCLQENSINKPKYKKSKVFFIIKILFILLFICILVFIFISHHQPTVSLVLRNVQEFIYPALKILRLVTLPFIKLSPSLSELYDETCLIENPYFQVTNMDCWPCENVHSVINLTDAQNLSLYQLGVPFIVKTLSNKTTLHDIQQLYIHNSKVFDQDAQHLKSTNASYFHVAHLLEFHGNNTDVHMSWRINRMTPARIIRTLFPKPHFVSAWSGQSTERFVFVDDVRAKPYVLPNPECGAVILTQGSGERTIVLKPSSECTNRCKTTSITLKPTYSLWYNWWYWRPISLPTQNATEVAISYLTSYC